MKKTTRLAALALSAIMALTMTACGGSNDAASASAASGAASAPAAAETYEIGYVNLADTDVFCMARETALNEAIQGTNFKVSYTDGNNDNQKQIDQTNAFIAKGVDALVLVPADSEAIVPAIDAAGSAGVPVVCLGIAASGGDFIYVGSENFDAGYMQGEYMAENLPEGAKVLYAAGTAGLQHSADRREGFLKALEDAGRSDIVVLDDQDADYAKDKAMRICDAWIQTYGNANGGVDFQAIICANDQMALGCMESLRGANLLTEAGEILITGVDGTDEAVAAVAEGYMCQTILQDAPGQAAAAFEVLQKVVAGESVEKTVIVPFQSITVENVADFQ